MKDSTIYHQHYKYNLYKLKNSNLKRTYFDAVLLDNEYNQIVTSNFQKLLEDLSNQNLKP